MADSHSCFKTGGTICLILLKKSGIKITLLKKVTIFHMIIWRFQRFIYGQDDESTDMAVSKETEQDTEGVDKKKTHVTYEGVAVPEIHFKSKE